MKKEISLRLIVITVVVSGISLVLSIASLCVSYPRFEGVGFDYLGVIVGILSLLVTILIGWQIYNVLTIRSEMEKRMEEIVSDRLGKMNYAIVGYTKAILSNALFARSDANTFDNVFEALENIIYSEDVDPNETALKCAISKINEFISYYDGAPIEILKGKRNHYIKLINRIQHEDKEDIILSLRNAIEVDA